MKKTKFFASIVAVIMLLTTLSTTLVSAAETNGVEKLSTNANYIVENNIDTTGITIESKTYNLYQVFSAMTTPTEGDDAIEYTVNPDFYGFFADKTDANGDVIGEYPTSGEQADIDAYNHHATEFVNKYSDNAQALVSLLRQYIVDNSIATTKTTGNYSITGSVETQTAVDVDLGYYAIFDSLAISGSVGEYDAVTNGSLVTIPGRATDGSLTADVTRTLKGSMPSIDKDIWHNDRTTVDGDNLPNDETTTGRWDDVSDYQIGDTVHFRLKVTVPDDISAYDKYDFIITDTLSDGLALNKKSIELYTDAELATDPVPGALHTTTFGADIGKDFTFQMNFDMKAIKASYSQLEEFWIYYTAVVTPEAAINPSFEQNKVELEFSNNPYDDTKKGKDEDTVYGYTFKIDVLKTKGDGVTALKDAKFALYEIKTVNDKPVETQIYLEQDTTAEVPTYYPAAGAASDDAGVLTTDETGKFILKGLDDKKDYVLKEIQAPEGYNAAEPITFKITAVYADNEKDIPTPTVTVGGDVDSDQITVINTSAKLLPETGGIGTTIFTITGIIIMLSAGAILFLTKSKKTSK